MNPDTHFSRPPKCFDGCVVKVDGLLTEHHLREFKKRFNKSGVMAIMKGIRAGALTRTQKRKKKDAMAASRNKRQRQRRAKYR